MKAYLKSAGVLIYLFVSQFIGMLGLVFYKISTDTNWTDKVINALENENIEIYMQLVMELVPSALILADILIIVPIVFYTVIKKEKPIQPIEKKDGMFIVTLAIVLNVLISLIVTVLPTDTTSRYNELMQFAIAPGFLPVLLTTGILAPIVEELIFRYMSINFLMDKGKHKAVFISALIFGIAHLNLIQGTYAFLLGMVLGELYVSNKNLTRPLLFHLAVNSGSVIYEYANEPIKNVLILIIILSFAYQIFYFARDYKNYYKLIATE